MNPNNQIPSIEDVTDQWVKYIEMFYSSTISITDFRNKGYSWSEIERIFKQAVENNQEIRLEYY